MVPLPISTESAAEPPLTRPVVIAKALRTVPVPETFIALPLTADQVDQAWPLVQSVYPRVSLDRWRTYATPLSVGLQAADMEELIHIASHPDGNGRTLVADHLRDHGLIALQSRGYIHGVFHFRVTESLTHGRTLQIDDIALMTPFSRRDAERALSAAILEAAEQLKCAATHTVVQSVADGQDMARGSLAAEGEVLGLLRAAGHAVEGVLLCRDMVPEPAPA